MNVAKQPKPLSPKKLEIRQRPGRILNISRRIMMEEGYTSLTIDRIAKEMNCSRPPIYESFASREDIVMGLAIEDAIQRWKLLKKAMTFEGQHREKLIAMSEFFKRCYPEHIRILVILQPNSIRRKATEKNRKILEEYEARSFEIGIRLVEDSVVAGDLSIPGNLSAAMIAYPMLCLNFGGSSFESRYPYWPLKQREFDRDLAIDWGFRAMLDGFGWKPLSHEWDYHKTIQRVHKEMDMETFIQQTENEKTSSLYRG